VNELAVGHPRPHQRLERDVVTATGSIQQDGVVEDEGGRAAGVVLPCAGRSEA
jgi:hypothetical protein